MVGTVFIDLKKAFDTVDHDLLCKNLEHSTVFDKGSVLGFNLIFPTENSTAEWVESILKLGKWQ